ncbi:hypothetical protein NQ318_014725 [Aromia moschata]|uniref:DDE-1 domain-containing protein n=1 Tax=Aromia moschata TaxID=1265417 RepID=A0AAV8ZC53_9CUCU|nr:hypothetical protein NQ318_014725 [Aromia moschata]
MSLSGEIAQQAEEETIAKTLGVIAKWGFPLNRVDVRDVIKKYLDKQSKELVVFKNNTPGPDFLDSFITRNNLFHQNCIQHKTVQVFDVKSINLYNYDETNVTDDPGAIKVIVPRNTKRVERVQEHSRASISIMVCGNPNGDLLPPMVVYKALNIYENWTQGGPVGTKYASSATNATHLMQPLDVAVFAPMKNKWREILEWRRESRYPGCIPKEQFPVLLGRLWSGISDSVSQNLVSGFRATGLHPPNPNEVLKRIPDGLDDAGEVVEINIDASLRELLQEHRGSGEKQKRKRGKEIEPGTNASAVNIEETELNVEEAQPNEEAGSETATMSECNGEDPYYNCPRCEDTDDEEIDDSEEDKDFVPSD